MRLDLRTRYSLLLVASLPKLPRLTSEPTRGIPAFSLACGGIVAISVNYSSVDDKLMNI